MPPRFERSRSIATQTTDRQRGVDRFSAGLQFHQMGDLRHAEECYRETIRIDPAHSDALHLMGVVALQTGRHDESVESIQRALSVRPRTAEYHNNLASAYRALGRFEESVDHLRRALDCNPRYAVAHQNLGNVLRELGRTDEAERHLRLAAELGLAQSVPVRGGRRRPPEDAGSVPHGAVKTVLHVGCGMSHPESLHRRFRNADWKELRLDIDPDVRPDIVASLTDMRAVADGSVDAVWSSHNVEHLYAHEVPVALREFHRVLKPGGLAFITLPDLQQIAHFILADKLDDVAYVSPAGPITTLDCVFGFGRAIAKGNEFMAHKTGFTETSLRSRLTDAGFVRLHSWTSPFNLWVEAYKPDGPRP